MCIPQSLDLASALSRGERRVLLKGLVGILDEPGEPEPAPIQPQVYGGPALLRLLDERDGRRGSDRDRRRGRARQADMPAESAR